MSLRKNVASPTTNTIDANQAIRDLLWVVNSPSLIDVEETACFDAGKLRFPDEDEDVVAKLVSFLNARATFRVGHYFEHLFHFFLQNICGFELLAQSLQIQKGARTIGEIDFIVRDSAGLTVHIETAVKFYLHLAEDNHTGSHLVVPNAADTFERKTDRLFSHQLPLSDQQMIPVDVSLPFVRGRIFYHLKQKPDAALPRLLSGMHLRETWIRHSELDALDEIQDTLSSEGRFRILPKPFWLSDEVATTNSGHLMTAPDMQSALRTHFRFNRQPRLLSVLDGDTQQLCETQRIFVVDDLWPN